MTKTIVIVGATSAMAQECAKLWSKNDACNFVLIGRNQDKLNVVKEDLETRNSKSTIECYECDFLSPKEIKNIVAKVFSDREVNIALIAHGSLPDQKECQSNLEKLESEVRVNALSPVMFAEEMANALIEQGRGRLGVIGSVAGDRGRQSNYIYGASKSLVEKYVQGLSHRFSINGVEVTATLIKPGPTKTPMTEGMAGHEKMASAEAVAKDIVNGIEKGKSCVYTPRVWQLIMLVIRNIPGLLFYKLKI